MKLMHASALIELLSALDDDALADLGLSKEDIEALDDVWENSHDYYEHVVGRPHPLAAPTPQDDAEMAIVVVIPVDRVVN